MKLENLKKIEKLSYELTLKINGGQSKKKKKKIKSTNSVKGDVGSDTTDTQKNDSFKK